MTDPLYRYEIAVEPISLRTTMNYLRAERAYGSNTAAVIAEVIDSTHHALAIPKLSDAQKAAKIVRTAENDRHERNLDTIERLIAPDHDPVNHPRHYTFYKGVEIIDLTEQMNFNRGNAVKYISRAGIKDQANEIQDLEKAAWYIKREIERLQKGKDEGEKSEGKSNAE